MILDTLEKFSLYLPVHPLFPLVSEFMTAHQPASLETGRTVIGRGITLSIDEYLTKPAEEKRAEFHVKYIDIQIVLSGIERAGIGARGTASVIEPYDPLKDVGFSDGALDFVMLTPAKFIVFFPHDLHKPGVLLDEPVPVKKAVFKIPVAR